MKAYPKVLIIGEQFDQLRGGGITLTNLFKDWPKSKIIVSGVNEPSSDTLTKSMEYYLLGKDEFFWPWPISRLSKHIISGPRVGKEETFHNVSQHVSSVPSKPTRARLLFFHALTVLGTDGLLPASGLSNQYLKWIKIHSPDVIYAQVASLQMIRFVTALVRASSIPLVIHQMDDWVPAAYGTGLFGHYSKNQADLLYKELSQLAVVRMSISEAMGESYKQRYGGEWQAFHNPIDFKRFNSVARSFWGGGKPFRIWYGGRIGWGNREGVADICRVVSELRMEGFNILLDVCTSQPSDHDIDKVGSIDGVRLCPFVPNVEIPEALAGADLLFLPLDWDDHSLIRAKLSMPTKASEYMASGTPSLVYAPAENALTQYAIKEGWAYVVSEHSSGKLKDAIVKLANDEVLREKIGRRAMEVASRNHDALSVRENFRRVLSGAADQCRNVN